MHSWNTILLVYVLAAVAHQANGSVLHSRKVDALIGQDKTFLPPRKDGTIPAIADCANLNQKEPKDPAGILPKWDLSGCCDATKFDKLLISPKHLAPN
ncbi:hypothetical protein H4Q26_007951 [Puccinia striiformis f. sp. tritici PST-130]|nr:hypothetical protein H4Q26_007951 [Puccinia striiformis f. sp. tritici PST-130]